MNKGLNLYFSETSWNQQQKCEVMSLTDIFSIILPTTDEWKVSKCDQQWVTENVRFPLTIKLTIKI